MTDQRLRCLRRLRRCPPGAPERQDRHQRHHRRYDPRDHSPLARRFDAAAARRLLEDYGMGSDAYNLRIHLVALARAVQRAQ